MPKQNVNMLALFFYFKDIEKMSRKLYNNRDKKGSVAMANRPYRKFSWDNVTVSFKYRANREISFMSETTTLVVEALKTLGKDRVDEGIILSLRNRLPEVREEKDVRGNNRCKRMDIYSNQKGVC